MDRVIVKCNSGFSPIEQILECDRNGVLKVMEGGGRLAPCGPMECGELYTPNSQIRCTTQKRTSPSQTMQFDECDKDRDENLYAWETFRYPNEFYIECNPGFVLSPFEASPTVQCSLNGTYGALPQCLDVNECEDHFMGLVISSPAQQAVWVEHACRVA